MTFVAICQRFRATFLGFPAMYLPYVSFPLAPPNATLERDRVGGGGALRVGHSWMAVAGRSERITFTREVGELFNSRLQLED